MKNILVILILIALSVSCSSDDGNRLGNLQLIGNWNWISSCGGFTGECWYPTDSIYETLEFSNRRYTKRINGNIDTSTSYSIIETLTHENSTLYVMELSNGQSIRFRFTDDRLNIEGGDFWKEYKRIE